jgi:hypothetical protein
MTPRRAGELETKSGVGRIRFGPLGGPLQPQDDLAEGLPILDQAVGFGGLLEG